MNLVLSMVGANFDTCSERYFWYIQNKKRMQIH